MADSLPTVDDVAAILRARTESRFGGAGTGTFDADTNPTGADVEKHIERYGRKVYGGLGSYDSLPNEDLKATAKDIIALYAAAAVELSIAPEQANQDRSVYAALRAEAAEDFKDLKIAVIEAGRSDGGPIAGDGGRARHSFPADNGGMIGMGTIW